MSTDRIQKRIDWLKRTNPKSPEIAQLQKKLKAGGGSNTPGGNPPASMESMEQFLGNIFAGMTDLDLSGAPRVLTAEDLNAERARIRDDLYTESTKYLDRDRARSREEAMQEMANRGIPYNPAAAQDPNTDDLYGKTLGAIDENYRAQQESALRDANTGADDSMVKQSSVNLAARNSWVDSAVQGWKSQFDQVTSANNVLQTLMQRYGIDQATAQEILNRKSNERLTMAGIRARGSGGSGGGGDMGGFEIAS